MRGPSGASMPPARGSARREPRARARRSIAHALGPWLLGATLAGVADAHGACWIDRERTKTADQLSVGDPRVAGMRAAARAMNDVLRRNAALHGLPEVRLRSTWQISGHPRSTPGSPYGFHLILWAHPRQVWGPGDCDLLPQADRVDPRAAVVVQTNSVRSTLSQRGSPLRDEHLEAFVEPEQVGRVGRHPLYRGQWVVLTFDGRTPWVPITDRGLPIQALFG